MKNDLDHLRDDAIAQSRPRGLGAQSNASSGGGSRGGAAPVTSTRVIGGLVRERWLVGDPFDDPRYYFVDPKNS